VRHEERQNGQYEKGYPHLALHLSWGIYAPPTGPPDHELSAAPRYLGTLLVAERAERHDEFRHPVNVLEALSAGHKQDVLLGGDAAGDD